MFLVVFRGCRLHSLAEGQTKDLSDPSLKVIMPDVEQEQIGCCLRSLSIGIFSISVADNGGDCCCPHPLVLCRPANIVCLLDDDALTDPIVVGSGATSDTSFRSYAATVNTEVRFHH